MHSIVAYQIVKAIDEERHLSAERRRQAKSRHVGSADADAKFVGGQSWRPVLRFPRFTAAPSKG